MNRKQFLKELAKLRRGLQIAKDNPDRPHCVQLPDGRIIDILDGETEKMLDEMEALARRKVDRD